LLSSIREQLFTLPDDYTLHCGHGPSTTVGHERAHNPFFPAGS
jgi:glyoxylase-like metal-dependent hydrolase (beta-lactamase superfamily II)